MYLTKLLANIVLGLVYSLKKLLLKTKYLFVCIYSCKVILQYAYILFPLKKIENVQKGIYSEADGWKIQ